MMNEQDHQQEVNAVLEETTRLRKNIFERHGHIPLRPFARTINKENQDTIVCVCGETLCDSNETIKARQTEQRAKNVKDKGKLEEY